MPKKGKVLPIFIFDTHNPQQYQMGSASKFWLHYSLLSLQKSLKGNLYLLLGNPKEILNYLINKHNINCVSWNRCYEPWQIARDKDIKQVLISRGGFIKRPRT